MWFTLAAPQIIDAGIYRELVKNKMTQAQIARAEEMARGCRESNYKQCDDRQTSTTGLTWEEPWGGAPENT